ncbi:outer membrane beta-barrel protein [Photobacterium sp. WH77]|uniref:Outer membrane beta-barrel protein n=1 Tax=Photobacterium arenosum TaxID=2774143 RepID=A0ABR9BGU5_9GAMM|nr:MULTISPECIES: outer membrane beta-barrel protein [Photobacterium]MBD8511601.1 outer membrane beta-barrel protein [Photobacterium arenosum]MBV7264304.1 outer membrane beta-barrel protein [Photobacterium sp. WH24]MCG2838307.1 outer membrane beta-barrel protein [Photobacterium sp. WH77]MCG2845978.1 outer membrane beta-barrel protein [Photobacterium sp. WH80]MDO6582635.1 outer membrane beta-barrel protein [Photobacterium sp. 2_MG-2023]
MQFRTFSFLPFSSVLLFGCLTSAGSIAATPQPTAAKAVADLPSGQEADQEADKEASRYFFGLRGGVSLMGLTDTATIAGVSSSSDDADANGFWGVDIGYYTPEGRSRLYYSFERHVAESQFPSSGLKYDNIANLNLLGTDYFFLYNKDFSPYVGLHFGYASVSSDSSYHGDYKTSGFVIGMQTGLAWRVSTDMTVEAGFRHTVLPSKLKNWQGQDDQGNTVNFESQQSGVSSLFLAANYRY